MTQGAGNSFLPKNMLRVVSLLKSRERAVEGSVVKAVVKKVLVVADVRVDARRNNECLAIVGLDIRKMELCCVVVAPGRPPSRLSSTVPIITWLSIRKSS